jgi:hypothetical protein
MDLCNLNNPKGKGNQMGKRTITDFESWFDHIDDIDALHCAVNETTSAGKFTVVKDKAGKIFVEMDGVDDRLMIASPAAYALFINKMNEHYNPNHDITLAGYIHSRQSNRKD